MVLIQGREPDADPGTHALVIGVSHYPFAVGPTASEDAKLFGLEDLTSAARSASEFAAWLMLEYRNPEAPLADVRVLLSPSEGETLHQTVSTALDEPVSATRAAVEHELAAFRESCRCNPANVGVVFVAGHGIQLNRRGAVVLLEDFGDPGHLNELDGAIDVAGCHEGMDEAGGAGVQFWFCDSCRQVPEVARRFEELNGALTLSQHTGHVESSPLFLAASTRESAFAEVGGTSIFSQALLWALRGGAAAGPDKKSCAEWHVGVTELIERLPDRVRALVPSHPYEQNVDIGGRPLDAVLHRFETPPEVDVVIGLRPEDATPAPVAEVLFAGVEPVVVPSTWPLRFRTKAGVYQLDVLVEPPLTHGVKRLLNVTPPEYSEVVEVQ